MESNRRAALTERFRSSNPIGRVTLRLHTAAQCHRQNFTMVTLCHRGSAWHERV